MIDSTNAESLRRPTPWRVVAAAHQSAGRGRLSRGWESPPGTSVAMSLTVPVPGERSDAGWLPLLAGVAMLDTLAALTGRPEGFGLKWPNDVLANPVGAARIGGPEDGWGKVCGILCEMAGGLVVIGVGVNITVPREGLPVATATSLDLCGHHGIEPTDVVAAFAGQVARRHQQWSAEGLDGLRSAYRSRCRTLGALVDIHIPDGAVVRGVASGIDDWGRVVLDTADGTSRAFAAGDVVHLRQAVSG